MSIPNFSSFKKATNEVYFSKFLKSVLTTFRSVLIKSSVSQVYDYATLPCFVQLKLTRVYLKRLYPAVPIKLILKKSLGASIETMTKKNFSKIT